jgi:hypothetical protein
VHSTRRSAQRKRQTFFIMHGISLITTIALGLSTALLFGLLARRVGLSPIVGYLVTGAAIGRHTPGFVGGQTVTRFLVEFAIDSTIVETSVDAGISSICNEFAARAAG